MCAPLPWALLAKQVEDFGLSRKLQGEMIILLNSFRAECENLGVLPFEVEEADDLLNRATKEATNGARNP